MSGFWQVARRVIGGGMDKVASRGVAVLKFIGISLGIDLALFVVVSLTCLIGARCDRLMWSERMFWVGMVPLVLGMAGMISWLGSGPRPFTIDLDDEDEDDAEAEGEDRDERDKPATTRPEVRSYEDWEDPDSESEDSEGLSTRAQFALRMVTVGVGAFAISALIEVLTR